MTASTDILARARAYLALAEKATPGPWALLRTSEQTLTVYSPARGAQKAVITRIQNSVSQRPLEAEDEANAAFIAASHEAADIIRALLTREAAPQEGRDERAAFEAWALQNGIEVFGSTEQLFNRDPNGRYDYAHTGVDRAWAAWQAATQGNK